MENHSSAYRTAQSALSLWRMQLVWESVSQCPTDVLKLNIIFYFPLCPPHGGFTRAQNPNPILLLILGKLCRLMFN